MKKGDILEMKIEGVVYPGKAYGLVGSGENVKKCWLKSGLAGQRVQVRITKKRSKKIEGQVLAVLEGAPGEIAPECPVFGRCGGCSYQNLPYEDQLAMKAGWVKELLDEAGVTGYEWRPILPSPEVFGYRNKMEFSFGDDTPGGPLRLGLHEKGRFYNIVGAGDCRLVHRDFGLLVEAITAYFGERGTPYFHKRSHEGYLRHVVIRRASATGEILVNLVTTSQGELDREAFVAHLSALPLGGSLAGILHSVYDGVADVVQADRITVLYGEGFIHDRVLGLEFAISPFSFFQTNTRGAEVLYQTVRQGVQEVWQQRHPAPEGQRWSCEAAARDQAEAGFAAQPVIFDLYCGTGTIAQVMAPMAKKVVGVELVEEAVEAAKSNAAANGLDNCTFIAGDVMEKVAELTDRPEVIILDPPREGIHPKAIWGILDFHPEIFAYVSCKASSLARDLPFFVQAGYKVESVRCVDMFPHTQHVETVVLMSRVEGK